MFSNNPNQSVVWWGIHRDVSEHRPHHSLYACLMGKLPDDARHLPLNLHTLLFRNIPTVNQDLTSVGNDVSLDATLNHRDIQPWPHPLVPVDGFGGNLRPPLPNLQSQALQPLDQC